MPLTCAFIDIGRMADYINAQMEDGQFVRLSDWGKYCPVSFAQTSQLVLGNVKCAVIHEVIMIVED
jgi:hypothetical protein